jgi:MFS family permease
MHQESLGPKFRWLWGAFAVSTLGTWLAFDAFPMIAVLALHAKPIEVSLLATVGLVVAAVAAVPLGPWVERQRKRHVMIVADAIRCLALATIPVAYAVGWLRFGQLLIVAAVVGVADICFRAASGACLKGLLRSEQLLTANARFESTTWTATLIGPSLGGAMIGMFGPVITVIADATSYLLSALGIRVIARDEPRPVHVARARGQQDELLEGWRYILGHPSLRDLFYNTVLVNGLVLATAPLIAVLMLGRLHVAPWQYGLAFAAPCVGGLIGARLARRLTPRVGQRTMLRRAGTLRACWSIGLAFIPGGWPGVALVAVVQLGLVTSMGAFNPVFATYRLEQTPTDRLVRTLAAWTISSKITVAALTALWGVLATVTGVRAAIAFAGVIMLGTPLLLPFRTAPDAPAEEREALAVA